MVHVCKDTIVPSVASGFLNPPFFLLETFEGQGFLLDDFPSASILEVRALPDLVDFHSSSS